MRARNIKPSLFKNEVLGVADPLLTILFQGLWCEADREGRLEDRPLRLKAEIFPYRNDLDIDALLNWLAANGFISRYEASGIKVIQVLKFCDHQRPHNNEAESVLPAMEQSKHNQGKKSAQPRRKALRSDSLNSDCLNIDPLNTDSPMPAAPAGELAALEADPPGLDPAAAAKFIAYRAKRKPAIRPESMAAFKRKLASFGPAQMAVVENSIAQGYQGLIEPKRINGHANGHDADPGELVWRELIASEGAKPARTPQLQNALEAVGGWPRIRARTPFDEPKIKREFCDALRLAS